MAKMRMSGYGISSYDCDVDYIETINSSTPHPQPSEASKAWPRRP